LLLGTQVKETGLEDKEGDGLERACDTLIMCIITTLNHGLRNGGGIGDILRKPATSVNKNFDILLIFFFLKISLKIFLK
jgi:hypothetical protein